MAQKLPITVITSRRIAVTTALLSLSGAAVARTAERTAGIVAKSGENPDAELIELCAQFCASEAAYCEIYDGDDRVADEEACAALAEPLISSWGGMLDRLAGLRATTHEGLAARAFALAQHSGIKPGTKNYPLAFDPDDDSFTGRLLHYLLRDATDLMGSAQA